MKPVLDGGCDGLRVARRLWSPGHFDDLAALPGRRHAEAVALALHDEHGHLHRVELGQAVGRRRLALARRRLEREGEAQHGDRAGHRRRCGTPRARPPSGRP